MDKKTIMYQLRTADEAGKKAMVVCGKRSIEELRAMPVDELLKITAGADSYGPATRQEIDLDEKLARFAEMGFSAIQFHDDDAVPNINNYTEEEIKQKARKLKVKLDKYGLATEFVAPRLWMDPHTIDGGFMSTSAEDREYAMWRALPFR